MDNIFTGTKKNFVASICPGILLGLMLVIGYYTKTTHGCTLTLFRLLVMVIASVVCTFVVAFIHALLDCTGLVYTDTPWPVRVFKKGFVYFFVCFFVIMILWMPSFLAVYPGIYAYDASWQYDMYRAGEVTAHQPVLHTYMVGFVIDTVTNLTGSINKGIAAYTLLQMIIMGLGCAYVPYSLYKRKDPFWMHVISIIWFCFFPPFVIFVLSSTKDSLFAIAVVDFVLLMLSLKERPERFFEKPSNMILWSVFCLEICIFRNNAIYAIIPVIPFLIVGIVRSECDKVRAFLMIGITALIFILYKYPITNLVTTEGVSKAEMLSVPCQQIMRVYKYHYEDLSEEDIEAVEAYFDMEKWYGYYIPEIADATKGSLRLDLYEVDSSDFWGLWKKLFSEYPQEYIDSFFENTYGFYYLWPHYVLYSYGKEGYTPVLVMGPGEQNSKIPVLLSFFKMFEDGSIVYGNSLVSWLFSPALYFYLFIIFAWYLIRGNLHRFGTFALFITLLWLTYLLGPVAMVRYALYLIAMVPLWPVFIRSRNEV